MSNRSIALKIDVASTTVDREIKRNGCKIRGFKSEKPHERAIERRRVARSKPSVLIGAVLEYVIERLRAYDSPLQISGRLNLRGILVSHTTIYRFIEKDRKNGGDLYKFKRHGNKRWRKKLCKSSTRGAIKDRVDISLRPAVVEEKSRIGDLEIDLIVGAGASGYILTAVDRHSKAVFMAKTASKEAQVVTAALIQTMNRMETIFKSKTITSDNGSEFAHHKEIAQSLGVSFFFARPYKSSDRGLNEHTNGLIRQFFPKKSSFKDLSDDDIFKVQFNLNNRPRKALNFKTPLEVLLSNATAALHV